MFYREFLPFNVRKKSLDLFHANGIWLSPADRIFEIPFEGLVLDFQNFKSPPQLGCGGKADFRDLQFEIFKFGFRLSDFTGKRR